MGGVELFTFFSIVCGTVSHLLSMPVKSQLTLPLANEGGLITGLMAFGWVGNFVLEDGLRCELYKRENKANYQYYQLQPLKYI